MTVQHRIIWLDAAKGMTIILVVMMHAALGVSAIVEGPNLLRDIVDFAQPFRIPSFFFLSGLLLPLALQKNWRDYLDAKLIHFAYFYVLWLTIQFALKAPHMSHDTGYEKVFADYLTAYIQPFGTLWFIYLLPIFFILCRIFKNVPALIVLPILAGLEMLHVQTGSVLIDELCARLVYFYAGYVFCNQAFLLAKHAEQEPVLPFFAIALWLIANGLCVAMGLSQKPFVSLALGATGICGMIMTAALLTSTPLVKILQACGRKSLIIYLSFFMPMAFMREVFIWAGWAGNASLMSLIITICAVAVPFVLYELTQKSGYGLFLFERPKRMHINKR